MISVMVRIIITGFEDFGSGSSFGVLFQFMLSKNWANFRFFGKKNFCEEIFFFVIKKN